MSKLELPKTEIKRTFTYRCFVGREPYQPFEADLITPQFHLERTDNYEAKIVEDRKTDWVELANKDVGNVGLANILKLAEKGLVNPDDILFKNEEAIDLSNLNPMDPQSIKDTINAGSEAEKKLNSLAASLGVTTSALIESFINGTFNELVSTHLKTEEGGQE